MYVTKCRRIIKSYEDIHNSWLYCFTNPLEIGSRVSSAVCTHTADDAKAKHVSQFLED